MAETNDIENDSSELQDTENDIAEGYEDVDEAFAGNLADVGEEIIDEIASSEQVVDIQEDLNPPENEISIDIGEDGNVPDLTVDGDDTIDVSQELRSLVDQSVTSPMLPATGGHWSGDKGDSKWIPNDDAIVAWRSGGEEHSITGAELKEKYGIEGVDYHNNEPDFSPFEDVVIGSVELDTYSDRRLGKSGTYSMASQKVAAEVDCDPKDVNSYMNEHDLTWHERGDCKTVQAIPTEINAAFKHTGGIGIKKSLTAVSEEISDRYGSISLEREGIVGLAKTERLKDALEQQKEIYRGYRT